MQCQGYNDELIDSYVSFLWLCPLKSSGILNHSSVTLWLCCHGEFPCAFTQPLPCPQSVTMETFFLSRISLIRTVARETISGIPISCPLQQTLLVDFFNKYVLVILGNLFISSVLLHLSRRVGLCLSSRTKKQFAWECCLLSCQGWSWNVNRYRHSFVCRSAVQWRRKKTTLLFFIILFQTWIILPCLVGPVHVTVHTAKPEQLWSVFTYTKGEIVFHNVNFIVW